MAFFGLKKEKGAVKEAKTKAVVKPKTVAIPKMKVDRDYSKIASNVILRPRITEKTSAASEALNVYTFEVA